MAEFETDSPAVRSVRIVRAGREEQDRVAVEAPLEIRLGRAGASTVLMRTPGDDEDLVRGFLYTESLISHASDVVAIRRPERLSGDEAGNVVAVEFAASVAPPAVERLFY